MALVLKNEREKMSYGLHVKAEKVTRAGNVSSLSYTNLRFRTKAERDAMAAKYLRQNSKLRTVSVTTS